MMFGIRLCYSVYVPVIFFFTSFIFYDFKCCSSFNLDGDNVLIGGNHLDHWNDQVTWKIKAMLIFTVQSWLWLLPGRQKCHIHVCVHQEIKWLFLLFRWERQPIRYTTTPMRVRSSCWMPWFWIDIDWPPLLDFLHLPTGHWKGHLLKHQVFALHTMSYQHVLQGELIFLTSLSHHSQYTKIQPNLKNTDWMIKTCLLWFYIKLLAFLILVYDK